jgi:hypothetical protein
VPKLTVAGKQTVPQDIFPHNIVALQLVVILAVCHIDLPNGIRMHGNQHVAVQDVDLKNISIFLPQLAYVIQEPRPPKTT